ncbi:MAG: cob(I)yrinic acid a,c-diamide adenosyltransferase [Phycisphaeraceae bacterium]|nr:cob(I)yrinic acid a,c-diamide adenosyltransferase [Phycisphaeraceae bacterium]
MVRISKVYTKIGDGGTTQLGDGATVAKSSLRVTAYGEVDEVNACIGRVIATIGGSAGDPWVTIRRELLLIQNELFDVGADLCVPIAEGEKPAQRLRISLKQSAQLEALIDRCNEPLAALSSFVLPGGSALAAELHVARTVCRRAERSVAALLQAEPDKTNPDAMVYLNRLSDLLFVLARVANENGATDVLWRPGAARDTGNPA